MNTPDPLADYDATMAEAVAEARENARRIAAGEITLGDLSSALLGDVAALPETGIELIRGIVAELRNRVAW